MIYYHVDVFSNKALSGNGLSVIFMDNLDNTDYMQALAKEFKQFESIFLKEESGGCFRARIFTVQEELDFAGHPILGAAATIHEAFYMQQEKLAIIFELNHKTIEVTSQKNKGYYEAEMNQGSAELICSINQAEYKEVLEAINLTEAHMNRSFPMEVVSTGLSYLLIPIKEGLEEAKIVRTDLEKLIGRWGAKFIYLFDPLLPEGRTWDNTGEYEDVATGSAAGPVGAYLYRHGVFQTDQRIDLRQGRFLERPSIIKISCKGETNEIFVAGDVKIIAKGNLYTN